MSKPIYINHYSLLNALGTNNAEVANNLFNGSQAGMNRVDGLLAEGSITIANVAAELPSLKPYAKHFQTRNNQFGLAAYQQIATQLEQLKAALGSHRIGVILGTSTSGIAQGEAAMAQLEQHKSFPDEYDYRQQEMSNIAEFIAEVAGVTGFCMTLSTACSSSAKCFLSAAELIKTGVIDAAIVGGVDTICWMTVNGFNALESTSAGICQPSSLNRDGINIGEAAALAIVSHQPSALMLKGGGESSDAHHMSAPHPHGEGAISAMQNALKDAQLSANDIQYINLHGTATAKNDAMEALAVAHVFPQQPAVSSSKGMIGHTLGAAGASEIGLCCLVLEQQKLAPHVWDQVVDPNLPSLNWVALHQPSTQKIINCLSNSFAFGGNNVSVIVGLSNE